MTALANTVFDLRRIAAAAPLADYKALVCVFLYGGNDGNNMLVPTLAADYARTPRRAAPWRCRRASLLPLHAAAPPPGDSREWGLHPSLAGLQGLFNARPAGAGRQRRPAGGAAHPRRST